MLTLKQASTLTLILESKRNPNLCPNLSVCIAGGWPRHVVAREAPETTRGVGKIAVTAAPVVGGVGKITVTAAPVVGGVGTKP